MCGAIGSGRSAIAKAMIAMTKFDVFDPGGTKLFRGPFRRALISAGPGEPPAELIGQLSEIVHRAPIHEYRTRESSGFLLDLIGAAYRLARGPDVNDE